MAEAAVVLPEAVAHGDLHLALLLPPQQNHRLPPLNLSPMKAKYGQATMEMFGELAKPFQSFPK